MKKLILSLAIAAMLPACQDRGGVADVPNGGRPEIRYYHDVRVDQCFAKTSECRYKNNSGGDVSCSMGLATIPCTDKVLQASETLP